MTELGEIFAELGISHYLNDFVEQGFDTWETILDITESDFDALGVKLGHRRKIQRKIANSRGLSADRALASPRNTPSDDRPSEEQQRAGALKGDASDGNIAAQRAKRKYRRHPKPDENAPERPPSAYVIFSNRMREGLKGRNLSFTEIAKLVGENWQNLSPAEKEPYEQQAASAKERYQNELNEYKKTESYKEYAQYLSDFKARQSNQQHTLDIEVAKRPKIEPQSSVASGSSGTSLQSVDTPPVVARGESSSSGSNPRPSEGTTAAAVSKQHVTLGSQGSPNLSSPNHLPGFHDSSYGVGTYPQQSLPWRDNQPDDSSAVPRVPPLANIPDQRPSHLGRPAAETLNLTGAIQHSHRTGQIQNHPPPLLTSESTNRSTTSSTSTGSSYFTPLTPMEPPPERGPSLPPIYPQKPSGGYDNQLPPLRPPSSSPQFGVVGPQQSPKPIQPFSERPPSLVTIRGFPRTMSQNMGPSERSAPNSPPPSHPIADDDGHMDPVTALLKAGEIFSRNSRT